MNIYNISSKFVLSINSSIINLNHILKNFLIFLKLFEKIIQMLFLGSIAEVLKITIQGIMIRVTSSE